MIEGLEDLQGKEFRDLTFRDKARIMSAVLSDQADPSMARQLAKCLKGEDHACGPDTCHNTCHNSLKAKTFDLLWARWMA